MASYIAEDPVHVVIRNEIPALSDGKGGMVRPAQRRLFAKFRRGTAPDWAREIGVASFEFRKMPVGVGSEQWLAFYDTLEEQVTNGWTDEERDQIERVLNEMHSVIRVDRPALAAPWPAYDKLVAAKGGPTKAEVAKKIAGKVVEDEYDAAHVLGYELENRARAEVVAALQELAGAPAAVEVEEEEEELVEA